MVVYEIDPTVPIFAAGMLTSLAAAYGGSYLMARYLSRRIVDKIDNKRHVESDRMYQLAFESDMYDNIQIEKIPIRDI